MGKTKKNPSYDKDGKDKQINILKTKLENRKAQVRRLKSYIRELEKKLEEKGSPIKESKVEKPKKLTDEEKNNLKVKELEEKRRNVIDAMKQRFGRKNES